MIEIKKTSNIPSMSVGEFSETLSKVYCSAIEKRIPLKTIPSVMLWGAPGIGKSQGVRQLAKLIEDGTNKTAVVTDVRLLLFNPIDLRGIPVANEEKTLAVWLKPKIFQMDPSEDVINILFLDEISAAPQSVQAAAYQITLDRIVGEHKLPENCIVIAAGNRITDKSVAFKMPKALANRLMHIEIEISFESWKAWAIKANINKDVIAFLSFKNDYLMCFDSSNDDLAFATPRSWEMVSNILNSTGSTAEDQFSLISGLVGSGVAYEFKSWIRINGILPNIEEVFGNNSKNAIVPEKPDALYALISSMVAYAREHNDYDSVANSIKYAIRMKPEFTAILFDDYRLLGNDFCAMLSSVPEYIKWIDEKGRMLNGSI